MISARRNPVRAVLAGFLLLTCLALSGCLRLQSSMSVTEEDRVSGDLVIAVQGTDGPKFQVPTSLEGKAKAEPYKEGDYTGTHLVFNNLTFDEVRDLVTQPSMYQKAYQFTLRRSGDSVNLTGKIDLSQLKKGTEGTDIKVSIEFPVPPANTNGELDGNKVTWAPNPGEVTELNATIRYAGADNASWLSWTIVVGLCAGAVAVLVGALALNAHRRQNA
ncbi:DUF3153 domain-containing protein [Pseudonocardiaceae bacterium YIM PH 21723]|nr:DUF3153 domain-containing protein [Pseudonocardiaceae bacterium YIM PH 21723]